MGIASFLGGFLLFAATILLLVSTISSPVVNNISLLNVNTNGATNSLTDFNVGGRLTFGVFGYCRLGSPDQCTNSRVGYDIAGVVRTLTGVEYYNGAIANVTKGFILHPIATVLSFIAFVIALFSDRFGFLFASIIAFLAFIASLIALILDFVVMTIVRNRVNDFPDNTTASYGVAIWLTLAATILLFFSSFVVCFGMCSSRRNKRRDRIANESVAPVGNGYGNEYAYGQHATGPYVQPKRKWYQRKRATGAATY